MSNKEPNEARLSIALANLPQARGALIERIRAELVSAGRFGFLEKFDLKEVIGSLIVRRRLDHFRWLRDYVRKTAKEDQLTQTELNRIREFAAKYVMRSGGVLDPPGSRNVRSWGWIRLYQLLAGKRDVVSYAYYELLRDLETGEAVNFKLCRDCEKVFFRTRGNQARCSKYCRTVTARMEKQKQR